ncbi:MAG: putative addiction module antidote protein [Deltaproteobacteria bacterium]|nr:putative addiction module antidote protein [Deltaproteobacteria bacterium]
MKTKKYKDFLQKELKNPKIAAAYLNTCLEEDDEELMLMALRDVAEAQGMGAIAKKTNISRVTLYRALSKGGNPEFNSLLDILRALRLRFSFKARVA